MSDNCPLCDRQLREITFYVRWFNTNGRRFEQCVTKRIVPSKRRFPPGMVEINGKDHQSVDIVNLATGRIARNDFKRPLPDWLKEPLARAAMASGGELPLIYKNSRVEKASRNPPIP